MQYILTQQQAPQGAGKYVGDVSKNYDAKRESQPKWIIEQGIIEKWIDELPSGSWVLDVPCGTGRFFDAYERNKHCVVGLDISPDQLQMAAGKVVSTERFTLGVGDVRKLPRADKSVDMAVMCRLTRWLSPEDCVVALKELQRVARKKIVITARVANHPHARSLDLINSALDGWKITKDEPGADMDYRIIMLEVA